MRTGRRPPAARSRGFRLVAIPAAVLAALLLVVLASLPPRRAVLDPQFADGTVAGIMHVHTNRSDGRGTPAEIAAAAARSGLRFVVLTDHGDATRVPDPPIYRSNVLCLDAVEISSTRGHYIALDMGAAPYPLAGDPRGIVEDVKRLGGFGIVAHPNSPKRELGWVDWDAPIDALEWINPDTSWRLRSQNAGWLPRLNLLGFLIAYPFRPAETIAALLPGTAFGHDRWARVATTRPIRIVSGADAHGQVGWSRVAGTNRELAFPFPSYDSLFGALSVHVRPDRPLTGDAAADARSIIGGLRRGHAYSAVTGRAAPPSFEFTASNGEITVAAGDQLRDASRTTLHVRSNAPPGFTTTVWNGARAVALSAEQTLARDVTVPDLPRGVYRVEIHAPPREGGGVWVVSNPIYAGVAFSDAPASQPGTVSASLPLFEGRRAGTWHLEQDRTSSAAFAVQAAAGGADGRLQFSLGRGSPSGQYVALAIEVWNGLEPYDRLIFSARSTSPIRLSVQLQVVGRSEGWERSIYLDGTSREYVMRFDQFMPMGSTSVPHPERVHDVLFFVGTVHSKPGTAGDVWIANPVLAK